MESSQQNGEPYNADLSIVDCLFDGNKVYGIGAGSVSGGAVQYAAKTVASGTPQLGVFGCAFSNNEARFGRRLGETGRVGGGALSVSLRDSKHIDPFVFTIANSQFEDNSAVFGHRIELHSQSSVQGGAVYLSADLEASISLNSCAFRANRILSLEPYIDSGTGEGGALFVHGGTSARALKLFDVKFVDNSVSAYSIGRGGAIAVRAEFDTAIVHSTFAGSSVSCFGYIGDTEVECSGGHIWAGGSLNLTGVSLRNGSVWSNTCGSAEGGAIKARYIEGVRVNVSDSSCVGSCILPSPRCLLY